ncbi:MAG: (2Fe-2S)-binding protein [Planctomycetaceae bacterium]|nr:(2Fe-2S)-binding protein [Planctomycetaceae bacterium]
MELDDTICYCFHVRKRKILNFIRLHKPRRASQISECGGAGTGCGWCVPFLKRYFDEAVSGDVTVPDQTTPGDYARQRANYIREGGGTPPAGAIPLPSDAPAPPL